MAQSKFFIEISETPEKSTIVADGKAIPVAKVNQARIAEFLEPLEEPTAVAVQKVMFQSIAPGTAVPKGTVVNVTLVPFGEIPIQIFDNPHTDLAERPVASIALSEALEDPAVRDILVKRDRPQDTTPEERKIVEAALRNLDIEINDSDPGRSYDRAHETARNALAFKI